METLVIGLDAATWDRIDDLVATGELPTLEGLLADGVRGDLTSTTPPMTPLAWPSMLTGVGPGEHGLFDFFELDRSTYELSTTDIADMDCPALWDVFDAEDVDAGFFNVPVAYPPPDVSEFFVSGIPSEVGQGVAHPPELEARLDEAGFEVHPDVTADAGPERYFEALVDHAETQKSVLASLLDDLDHLWTVFMGLDWAQHYLRDATIDGEDAVDRLYRVVDGLVGDLLAAVEGAPTVLVVSDHGARRIHGEVHLNSVLADRGYLERAGETHAGTVPRVRDGLLDLGWRVGRSLPRAVREAIKRAMPGETMDAIESAVGVGHEAVADEIDWANTTAFAYGYMGRVFVHAAAGYAEGTVPPEEYEAVKADLAAELESLTHPETDDPLVDTVLDAQEVYDGPHADAGADLIVVPTDWRYMFYGDFGDEWFHPPEDRLADHDPEGVLVASGPGLSAADVTADVTDVAPTLLALHGLPVLDAMDGAVVDAIAGDGDVPSVPADRYRDTGRASGRSDADEAAAKDRLEDLGYL
jgi:predicted AlkP superfamily phosphohydrolase/phosphomutase